MTRQHHSIDPTTIIFSQCIYSHNLFWWQNSTKASITWLIRLCGKATRVMHLPHIKDTKMWGFDSIVLVSWIKLTANSTLAMKSDALPSIRRQNNEPHRSPSELCSLWEFWQWPSRNIKSLMPIVRPRGISAYSRPSKQTRLAAKRPVIRWSNLHELQGICGSWEYSMTSSDGNAFRIICSLCEETTGAR